MSTTQLDEFNMADLQKYQEEFMKNFLQFFSTETMLRAAPQEE